MFEGKTTLPHCFPMRRYAMLRRIGQLPRLFPWLSPAVLDDSTSSIAMTADEDKLARAKKV